MKIVQLIILLLLPFFLSAQFNPDQLKDQHFKKTLALHKELVSIPNLPDDPALMLKNINWVAERYQKLDFKSSLLETSSLPILLVEKEFDPKFKTILFYFHIDGQPVNPAAWNQADPFIPVLKKVDENGDWQKIDWKNLEGKIDDEWRVFARASADDKAPIIMFLSALEILAENNKTPKFNIKVIFDPQEEYGSEALLSTIDQYKNRYTSDYLIVMDGPAHDSNKPTLTFGCRGIALCSMTTYGGVLPQHSGHLGNYVPNPVFGLSRLLSSMKDEEGRVLIKDYYAGIEMDEATQKVLSSVPYDAKSFNHKLGICSAEHVGHSYQEALQYPTLNVRQIGTSWKGEKLKTVIPEYARADIDVRLVPETEGAQQLEKIKRHLQLQDYYVIGRDPNEVERRTYPKIVKFKTARIINSFRTDPTADFGQKLSKQLSKTFGYDPVVIRMMGGTVPIVPIIDKLDVPTVIVPMVNMDNNQHSPNENIRIGNIREGIKICLGLFEMELGERE